MTNSVQMTRETHTEPHTKPCFHPPPHKDAMFIHPLNLKAKHQSAEHIKVERNTSQTPGNTTTSV